MRKIGIRYYDTQLNEENFTAMSEGGMTAIDRATNIGVDKFVIHPSWVLPEDIARDDAKAMVADALDRLAKFAHARGAALAVENLPCEHLR